MHDKPPAKNQAVKSKEFRINVALWNGVCEGFQCFMPKWHYNGLQVYLVPTQITMYSNKLYYARNSR